MCHENGIYSSLRDRSLNSAPEVQGKGVGGGQGDEGEGRDVLALGCTMPTACSKEDVQ